MEYVSPKLLNVGSRICVSIPLEFEYTDPYTKLTLKRNASTLVISQDEIQPIHEHETSVKFDTIIPSTEKFLEYCAFEGVINICVKNAEDIKNKLLHFNLQIPLTDAEQAVNVKILKLDFMKLKDRFLEFVKKDMLIKSVDEYSSNQKMKPFRVLLDRFILDRDIYTHGQLHFLKPNFEFVIEYVSHSLNKKQYAFIDLDTIKSFNNFYIEINRFLKAYRDTRNK